MGRAVGWFGVWMVLGAALALGTISVIGIFVLPVATLAMLAVTRARSATDGLPGVLSGLGLPLLYVAYLNRAGPDPNYCHAINHGTECTELMNPWPWFAIGAALVLGGVAVFAYRQRASCP
jgi:hypothetical protein